MKPLIIYIFLSLPILHVIDINDYHYTPISTSHIAETGSQRISSAIDKFSLPVGNILFVAILKAMVKNTKEVFDSYRSFLSNLFISRMVKSIRNHSQYAKQGYIEVNLSHEANSCAMYCSLMLSEKPHEPLSMILIIAVSDPVARNCNNPYSLVQIMVVKCLPKSWLYIRKFLPLMIKQESVPAY